MLIKKKKHDDGYNILNGESILQIRGEIFFFFNDRCDFIRRLISGICVQRSCKKELISTKEGSVFFFHPENKHV